MVALDVTGFGEPTRIIDVVWIVVLDATPSNARRCLGGWDRYDDACTALYASGVAGCVQEVEMIYHAA